jgi:hypothetical protein
MRFSRLRKQEFERENPSRLPDASTVATTILLSLVIAVALTLGRVEARTASAGVRNMRVIDVWRAMLDNLPDQAPGIFTREVVIVMLIVGLISFAYMLAVTLRVPR